ncbi:MAG: helix-turn-helix domain-containing protein [Clostridia bacterium]|nr:helix-turn-helix domain-containing protein [Clostridia bacterium]
MDKKYKFRAQLCISTLSVSQVLFDNAYHFEMRNRKIHNSFGYITSGSVEFSILSEKIVAKEGDLIFVPEGVRYMSNWVGHPRIRFYNVHFLMPKISENFWRNMPLQRIDGAPNEKIREMIEQMYECATGNDADHLQAFGLFYQMLSLVLPHMISAPVHNIPQPLQTAIAYIEANYASITSVREIASACFFSESHLYHLFREHLGISPISYLNRMRVHAAIDLLSNPDLSIQQIAERLNFRSDYYFRKTFQKITGHLPSKLRKML